MSAVTDQVPPTHLVVLPGENNFVVQVVPADSYGCCCGGSCAKPPGEYGYWHKATICSLVLHIAAFVFAGFLFVPTWLATICVVVSGSIPLCCKRNKCSFIGNSLCHGIACVLDLLSIFLWCIVYEVTALMVIDIILLGLAAIASVFVCVGAYKTARSLRAPEVNGVVYRPHDGDIVTTTTTTRTAVAAASAQGAAKGTFNEKDIQTAILVSQEQV